MIYGLFGLSMIQCQVYFDSYQIFPNGLRHSGRLIASGQINHMGFRAYVILWDWTTQKEICRHELHKVQIHTHK